MTIYRPGWHLNKEEEEEKEKEKGKSNFSFLSCGAAAVTFDLALTQQLTRGGAAIQTIFLFSSAFGKGDRERGEGIINFLFLILCGGAGRSTIDTTIREREEQHDNQSVGALQHKQSTRSGEEEEEEEKTPLSSSFFDPTITATTPPGRQTLRRQTKPRRQSMMTTRRRRQT